MPYVEVWVDDDPCDGNCEGADEAKRLQSMIDEAINLLKEGNAEAALDALDDDARLMKSPDKIKAAYETWKRGGLPGFVNYVCQEGDTTQ